MAMPHSAASLIPDDREARVAFKRWCKLFREEGYPDNFEKEKRFTYFNDTFHRKVNPSMLQYGINMPEYADRSEQEFNDLTSNVQAAYCFVSHQILDQLEEDAAQLEDAEEDNSSVPISDEREARELFERWCRWFREGGYANDSEKEKRFTYFKDTLNRKVNPSMLRYGINAPAYADRSEQEYNDLKAGAVYCSVSNKILDQLEELELEELELEMKDYPQEELELEMKDYPQDDFSGCSS